MSNVNKKSILLQVYNFIYLYYGLAAIKTIFGNDFVVDILLISDDNKEIKLHDKYAKSFSCIKNIHILSSDFSLQIQNSIKRKSFLSALIFKFTKYRIIKKLKYFFAKQQYDEVFFCHENRNFNISAIKICYPNANFTMYGDGFGLFCSAGFDYYKNIRFKNPYIIDEICPNRVIGLLPCNVDEIMVSHKEIPIFATNKYIMRELLKSPKEIKLLVDNYVQDISSLNREICLFMTSCLAEVGAMDLNEEVNMNIEIIRTNLPSKTIILIKPHPREQGSKVKLYKEILKDDYMLIELPKKLQKIPVELMGSLLAKTKYLITYGTAFVTLKYLYDIDHIDISKVLSKYGYRQSNEIFDEVYKRLATYNGNGLVYSKKWLNHIK